MQTAVDYNGSNNSNNGNSITTTLTLADVEEKRSNAMQQAAMPTSASNAQQHATMTTKTSVLINDATQNVLRQRRQSCKDTEATSTTIKATPTLTSNAPMNKAAAAVDLQLLQSNEVADEYLGSNVQQMALTPTPSPRASPSKTSSKDIKTNASTKLEVIVTDFGSDSNIISTTNSSTSPMLMHGLEKSKPKCLLTTVTQTMHTIGDGGGGGGEVALQRPLPPKTLPLPLKTGAYGAFHDFELKTPYTPTSSSSSASSASTAPIASALSSSASTTSQQSLTPSLSSAAGQMATHIDAQLLQWKDMPQYLQFNPYVLNGYRPLQTFKGCLLSLFYWHNETINILTHAIPIIYILTIVPGLMPWDRGYRFLSFCHLFGAVAPWCGSFVYHLFMNIEKGENVYYRLLKLDMVGIWVSQSFGALPLVTATTFCFTFKWKWFIIISYCLLSLWGLYKALTASSPWQRRLCFALPFTMRSILTFLRTLGLVGGNRVALSHVYLQDGVSILGGAIGAMRIPEKWFPGLVDFYLNSHNIMHVLVVVAVYSMHKATMKDFEWMNETTCEAFNNATNEAISQTFGANIEL